MKTIIRIIVLLAVVGSGYAFDASMKPVETPVIYSEPTTEWLGFIAYIENRECKYITCSPRPLYEDTVEIGLRSDGVVVWRKVEKK
jgi:hypothetical protein